MNLNSLVTPEARIKNSICECIMSLVFSIPWAVAFGKLSQDSTRYYPCSPVSSSYEWSNATFIFYVITCCLQVFSCACVIISIKVDNSTFVTFCSFLVNLIRSGLGVTGLTMFAGLCHSFGENENCGDLNNLIEAFIIIFSIGMGMGCVIACCMLCCGVFIGGTMMKMGLKKQLDQMAKQYEQEMKNVEANQGNGGNVNKDEKGAAIEIHNEAIQPLGGLGNDNQA